MPELSPAGQRALTYWGSIQSAVSDRASTSEVWSAIRGAAASLGLDSPGITVAGVNELRSYAASARNAMERIDRAPDSANIIGRYVSAAPWGRSMAEQNAVPRYQVNFEHTTILEGQEVTSWRPLMIAGAIPGTVGDLRDAVEAAGNELADDYDMEHVGIGRIQVLTV